MSYLILSLSIHLPLQLQSSTSQNLAQVARIISSYNARLAAEEQKLAAEVQKRTQQRIKLEKYVERIKLEKFKEMCAHTNTRNHAVSACSSPCCASSIDSHSSKLTAIGSSPSAVANSIKGGSDDVDSESSCTSNFQPLSGGDSSDEDQPSRVENDSIYGYEQVLDLDSFAKTISSLARNGATTRVILQKCGRLPDGEGKLMRVLLRSLALFDEDERMWNIKPGKKTLKEVQVGIVEIWNATLDIPGTVYPQASDNCYSWMKIHGVPVENMDALFNKTVIDMYENKMATYSKHELYHPERRKPWEGMTDFSKLTAI